MSNRARTPGASPARGETICGRPRTGCRWATPIVGVICGLMLVAAGVPPALAQEFPGKRLDDILIVARFNDGYWAWYHDYLRERDEQRQRTTEIRMQVSVIAAERTKLRAEWLRYLYLENQLTPTSEYDPGWGPYWQSFLGVGSAGELAGELRRELDDIAHRWSAGVWGAPLADDSLAGDQLEASYQGERDIRRTQINQWKERQRELMDEALRLNRALASSCQTQKEKSGDKRPWLDAEIARLQDEHLLLRVYLHDAARWYLPDELPVLIDELDLENRATQVVAALMQAKLYLAQAAVDDERIWLQMTSPRQQPPDGVLTTAARTARLEAIRRLREVLRLDADNAEARGMLMNVELWWLREIAAKLDLERRASLDAFRAYMTARGFYADQPKDWSEDLYEIVGALWGLGPIALTAGLPGLDVAGARATELDVTQTAAARNQVTLLSIIRLVKNGVTLAEIPALSAQQIAEHMTLHTAEGRPLSSDKARRIAQDIYQTLSELDDLRLLVSSDDEYFVRDANLAFGKGYYAPLDPSYTWYESFGDLLNIHNVAFLWGPGSIVRMNGELATVGMLSSTEIQAAERAGQLLTGKQAFLSLTRLDRLAETVASTGVGARWANALAADKASRQRLTLISTGADLGARLSSAAVLYSSATYLAQQAGIPGAAILVELLGEIGPGELLSDVVTRSGAPLDEIGDQLDEFAGFLAREQGELADSRVLLNEVSELAEELSEEAVDASRQATIQERLAAIAEEIETRQGERVANSAAEAGPTQQGATVLGSVADPVDDATGTAVASLRDGNLTEARAAMAAAEEMAEDAGTRVEEAVRLTEEALAALDSAAGAPGFRVIAPDQLPTVRQTYQQADIDRFWRHDLYSNTGPGRSLQLGDEAIRRGDLDAAYEHFRSARREIYASGEFRSLRGMLDHTEGRLDVVINARRTGDDLAELRRTLPASNAADAIDEQRALEVVDNLERSGAVPGRRSANPVSIAYDNDGNAYYVKRIEPDPNNALTRNLTPEDVDRILATEAAASSLGAELGLTTAGARYVPERGVLVTRAIPNETAIAGELAARPEHVALAVRESYAQQRIFRAWLGDGDGHLGNMILGDDGRLYVIDFDLAELNRTESRQILGSAGQSDQDLMEGTIINWSVAPAGDPRRAPYRWMTRLDQTIRYEDVRGTVEAIQELTANPEALRRILTEANYPDIDGAIQRLTERAGMLEEVFQPLLDGQLLNLRVSAMPERLRRAA